MYYFTDTQAGRRLNLPTPGNDRRKTMTDNSDNRGDSSRKPYIAPFLDLVPEIEDTVFVAATAAIMGAVRIGAHSSIWHQVTVRGDNNYILIGTNTNIQDNSCVHIDGRRYPTVIGNDVTIGHSAIIHACEIGDGGFVGMGAIVMDGAVIEPGGMLAAGAMLTPGKRIPSGELWAGRPAKKCATSVMTKSCSTRNQRRITWKSRASPAWHGRSPLRRPHENTAPATARLASRPRPEKLPFVADTNLPHDRCHNEVDKPSWFLSLLADKFSWGSAPTPDRTGPAEALPIGVTDMQLNDPTLLRVDSYINGSWIAGSKRLPWPTPPLAR